MLRHLTTRCCSQLLLRRSAGVIAPCRSFLGPPAPFFGGPPRNFLRDVQRRFDDMQHEFDRVFNNAGVWRPFLAAAEHPSLVEAYRVRNPIVEEDGVKKFKLEFDVRRFRPEDIKISTNAKDRTLSVEAKFADETSKAEYERTVTIPEGVTPGEVTCTYRADGTLLLEAPYVEPVKADPPKDTVIDVKHN